LEQGGDRSDEARAGVFLATASRVAAE
jgi:hypothetical protein